MVKALFDTNVLIDYLNEVAEAKGELERYTSIAISVVTWMEIMVGAPDHLGPATSRFLSRFDQIDIDLNVAERAVILRREHKIKLPDAIIWATAQTRAMLFVTRNTKDFPADEPGIRIPYRL